MTLKITPHSSKMTLKELITAIKEKNLTKEQLEDYRDDMSHVYAEMQMELAEVEKAKALYFEEVKHKNPEAADISIKRNWQVQTQGRREIELKRYCLATKELLN